MPIVLTPIGETKSFDFSDGILQGDTWVPFLFIIVLGYVIRRVLADGKYEKLNFVITSNTSRRYSDVALADHVFADDIELLSYTMQQSMPKLE